MQMALPCSHFLSPSSFCSIESDTHVVKFLYLYGELGCFFSTTHTHSTGGSCWGPTDAVDSDEQNVSGSKNLLVEKYIQGPR